MLTESAPTASTVLFLLAHQDDEFGIFYEISAAIRRGDKVFCVFATDGARPHENPPSQRDKESLRVLQKLGVTPEFILFPGHLLGLIDGRLHEVAAKLSHWLETFLNHHPEISRCFVPAWEGGHPDHDTLHAVAVRIKSRRPDTFELLQFPLYNAYQCSRPFFNVFFPLVENGPTKNKHIAWADRLMYLGYCLCYPSQWRTWLGLFPFVLRHYFLSGTQSVQEVSLARVEEKPHDGTLYYEARNFITWPELQAALKVLKI